jgi:hypothetical protein
MTAKWLAVAAVLAASPPPLHRAICLNRQSHPPLGVPLKVSGRPLSTARAGTHLSLDNDMPVSRACARQ